MAKLITSLLGKLLNKHSARPQAYLVFAGTGRAVDAPLLAAVRSEFAARAVEKEQLGAARPTRVTWQRFTVLDPESLAESGPLHVVTAGSTATRSTVRGVHASKAGAKKAAAGIPGGSVHTVRWRTP